MPISPDSPLLQDSIWEWLTEGENRRLLYTKNAWFNRAVDAARLAEAIGRDPMPCLRDALEAMALEIAQLMDQAVHRARLESYFTVLHAPPAPRLEIG